MNILQQTMVYAASIHTDLDFSWGFDILCNVSPSPIYVAVILNSAKLKLAWDINLVLFPNLQLI